MFSSQSLALATVPATDTAAPAAPAAVVKPTPQKAKALPVGCTMAELKTALPDYFNAPSLSDAFAAARDKGQKWAIVARALTRLALIAAHSGTVNTDAATLAEGQKGATKSRMLACHALISEAKATFKGASLAALSDRADIFEAEFLALLQPAPIGESKTKSGKTAAEKIIAAIQGATLTAAEVRAIRAALSNVTPVTDAPL